MIIFPARSRAFNLPTFIMTRGLSAECWINDFTDPLDHILERLVAISPAGNSPRIPGQCSKLPELRSLPINRPQDNRDNPGVTQFMAFQCPFHLHVVAVV